MILLRDFIERAAREGIARDDAVKLYESAQPVAVRIRNRRLFRFLAVVLAVAGVVKVVKMYQVPYAESVIDVMMTFLIVVAVLMVLRLVFARFKATEAVLSFFMGWLTHFEFVNAPNKVFDEAISEERAKAKDAARTPA